jgi:hypothetical protein
MSRTGIVTEKEDSQFEGLAVQMIPLLSKNFTLRTYPKNKK